MSYRGVRIGQVEELVLTDDGVDILLDIDNEHDRIPADARALVGNRSAVGEQYVELQPQSNTGPYLEDRSEIARDLTRTPIQTDTLLTHLDETVHVDEDDLQVVTEEFGLAFGGAGQDLQTIIDSSNDFIEVADQNFDVTVDLIRDSFVVLNGQIDSESAFRRFARDLSSFSTTLAGSDEDLRRLIDEGSAGANELRVFLEDNEVELGELVDNLVTTGEVVVKHLDGVERLLSCSTPTSSKVATPSSRRRRPRACTTPTSAWCSPTSRTPAWPATRAPTAARRSTAATCR